MEECSSRTRRCSVLMFILSMKLFLVACTAVPLKPVPFVMKNSSENGILALSITYDIFSGYTIYYRGIDNPEVQGSLKAGQGVMLIPIKPAGDFQDYGLEGEVVTVELPPGKYELYGFGVQSGVVGGRSEDTPGVVTQVVPGATTYTGNFHFEATRRFGLAVTSSQVNLADKYERDKEVLAYKYIGIDRMPILKGVPDGFEKNNVGSISGKIDFGTVLMIYSVQ